MGGWAWQEVADHLAAEGHTVAPVTYSSMGDHIGLDDHVDDVVRIIDTSDREESEEIEPIVLVGHSYGGLVAGIAADRARHHSERTVFVDSPVPMGSSMLDALPPDISAAVAEQIAETGFWMPPPPDVFIDDGVSANTAEEVADLCTPHPGKTLQTPAGASVPPSERRATYVRCVSGSEDYLAFAGIDALKCSPRWEFLTIESGHWPMLSAPRTLGALLAGAAEG